MLQARIVRLALGGILIVAAGLKCYGAWRGETIELPMLRSLSARIALVEVELILGTWLISGIAPRYSYFAAVLGFSCFLVAACYEVVSRARSCGCFGPVPVSPKATVVFDVVALVTLLTCRRGCQSAYGIPRGLRRLTILGGCLFALTAPVIMLRTGQNFGGRRIVFLDPATWRGRDFALQEYVNGGGPLREGNWVVMLYRHECPSCEAAMPSYLGLADRVSRRLKRPARIAFVEVPPYGAAVAHDGDVRCYWYRLAETREWAGATPIVLLLRDGKVEAASQGEAAVTPPEAAERWIDGG